MLATAPQPLPTDLRQLSSRRPERPVPFVQGTYYLLIGLWPLVALDSLITGSAGEASLRAFGRVVIGVGVFLLYLAARHRGDWARTATVGVLVALALAAADVALVLNGTAPPVYLADAVIQVAFVFWWGRDLVPHDPEVVGGLRTGLT